MATTTTYTNTQTPAPPQYTTDTTARATTTTDTPANDNSTALLQGNGVAEASVSGAGMRATIPSSSGPEKDTRPVFFFDIDNCLYPRSYKIHDMMKVLINNFFQKHLQLDESTAHHLHHHYYRSYGLALSGLILHHTIDPLEYNSLVDDALPLESVIRPSPALTALLTSLRTAGKVKMWLFTNAYVNHARRVVRLLGVEDLFDGVTYCDYEEAGRTGTVLCKPKRGMYVRAMREAGLDPGEEEEEVVENDDRENGENAEDHTGKDTAVDGEPTTRRTKGGDWERCYFVDDSHINCQAAYNLGWERTVHLLDPADPEPQVRPCKYQIRDLAELRTIFPELFLDDRGEAEVEVDGPEKKKPEVEVEMEDQI